MTYDKINYWYGWNGGECPVHPDTQVEVIYRGRSPEIGPAGLEDWAHDDHSSDIIAFSIRRLYVEPRVPREWWVNCYNSYATMFLSRAEADYAALGKNRIECIHVLEVLEEPWSHEMNLNDY
jgi:hypothetical protein